MFFKSIDEKFNEIGFYKVQDDEYLVCYERKHTHPEYTQVLSISHKANGRHLVHSYDKDLFDSEVIGNTCVGLTGYEMKLALKKMKQKGWKSK